jgi:hypothetical protein
MSEIRKPPAPIDRYLCIVDRDAGALAAVVSSYLFEKDRYLPLFMFPPMTSPKTGGDNLKSDIYLSNLLGNDTSVLINNAWARMGGSEYLILAGLSRNQTSYLSIPKGTKIIEIAGLDDIAKQLSTLVAPEAGAVRCRTSDILKGLWIAQREGKRLVIDEAAKTVPDPEKTKGGIVVVEDNGDVGSVVGVNYASSVGANLAVVDGIGKREVQNIHRFIRDWRDTGDGAHLQKVKDAVLHRVGATSFPEFEYATFFTEGLPYSLVIGNVIPCSHIHLALKPDLFVFNSIIFEQIRTFRSAVVFSPVFFADEETQWLVDFFTHSHYYLRQLIGRDATLANLDFNAQHFPYGVLHICSHGGEVDGWEVSEEFVDREGKPHVIEYDEVVGYDPVADKDGRVRVHRKTIFRRLDGFRWMSDELDKQNIPSHVFHDMWQALYLDQRGKLNTNAKRKKKGRIASSCAIRCSDSIHQGQFTILASHSSPLVFNNTCWSWYDVAAFFLACGARGYIGTLWAIDNDAAILGARTFYENLFSGTVLAAFQEAVKAIAGTQSKDIYIYWGLHFTTLSRAKSAEQTRTEVFGELLQAVGGWGKVIQTATSTEVKRNATRVLNSVLHELNTNFGPEDMKALEVEMIARMKGIFRGDDSAGRGEDIPIAARSSIDHPVEYEITGGPNAENESGR